VSTPESSNTGSPAAPAGAGNNSIDWEACWQRGDTPWDKGAASPPLLEWLSNHTLRGLVLVPGCGSGHDVRALARAGAEPIGLDHSPSAINVADSFPRVGPERYRLANLFELPPEMVGVFDWVVEHTCFCAIPRSLRANYVEAVAAALKPGGHLLAIFYLNPHDDGTPDEPPFGTSRKELDTLFSPRFALLDEYVPTAAFPGREQRELVRLHRLRD